MNEQQLLSYGQPHQQFEQRQFRIRTISIENFIFASNEIEGQKNQNEVNL